MYNVVVWLASYLCPSCSVLVVTHNIESGFSHNYVAYCVCSWRQQLAFLQDKKIIRYKFSGFFCRRGDVITSINYNSTKGLTHSEVVSLLNESSTNHGARISLNIVSWPGSIV